jgi:hypothetical protein
VPGAVPAAHSRSISWCSVTTARTGGTSKTWRRSTPVTGRPARPAPQRPQQAGSCQISRSGRATCVNVVPLCPSCPPGRRPLFFRNDRGAGLASPSLDGGLEEFRGVCLSRASSSAIRSSARSSSPASPPPPRAATPPARQAPHTAAGLDQQAHRDTTALHAERRQQIKNVVSGTGPAPPPRSHFVIVSARKLVDRCRACRHLTGRRSEAGARIRGG